MKNGRIGYIRETREIKDLNNSTDNKSLTKKTHTHTLRSHININK